MDYTARLDKDEPVCDGKCKTCPDELSRPCFDMWMQQGELEIHGPQCEEVYTDDHIHNER